MATALRQQKRLLMRIHILSRDAGVIAMVRETLSARFGGGHELITAGVQHSGTVPELWIWDFDCEPAAGSATPPLDRSIVLIERNGLRALRSTLCSLPLEVVVKPLTRARLEIAFEQAFDETANRDPLQMERDDILECLLRTNVKLQEYDQDRNNFLARALHDLRAPLTSVNGYCALLLSGEAGDMRLSQEDLVRRMQRSIQRLTQLTNEMFQLSVGNAIRWIPERRAAEIHECVQQAVHEVAQTCSAKGIDIDLRLEPAGGPLIIDRGAIERLLVNLLDNACKFTPKCGRIRIAGYPYFWERRAAATAPGGMADRRHRASTAPNAFRIDICDSGPTIRAECLEEIFEEYTSYKGSGDRSGAGLGLAICRMIARLHEGRVWAEANSEGAKFSLLLPYSIETRAAAPFDGACAAA